MLIDFFRFVAPFLNAAKSVRRGLRHMGPLVKERLEQEARYGKDWPERPVGILCRRPMMSLTFFINRMTF